MILTCPKCASRFKLKAFMLAPEGRHVKCSQCGEIWHQLPDPDELLSDIEMQGGDLDSNIDLSGDEDMLDDNAEIDLNDGDIEDHQESIAEEDIPEGVKPIQEETNIPALNNASDDIEQNEKPKKAIIILYAALIGMLLMAPLFIMKAQIMNAWPESIAFYQMFGTASKNPGEGIVFDQMRTELNDQTLTLTGQVINLTAKDSPLPLIEVQLKDETGKVLEYYYIKTPQKYLKAEETLPIKAEYQVEKIKEIFDISVRFVIKTKTQ